MNNQTDQALAEFIKQTTRTLTEVTAFGKEQIPDVLHQLLVWNFAISFLPWVLGTTLLVITPFLFWWRYTVKRSAQADHVAGAEWTKTKIQERRSEFHVCREREVISLAYLLKGTDLTYWPALLTAIVGLALFFMNWSWLQIWLAPKYYLLQYATDLITHTQGK